MNKINIFDSLEDFKAAFVTVNEGFNGCLKSPKKLMNALHQCGRNPDKKAIEKYWNMHNYIDIDIFCKIASEEKKTSEDDLLLAFKILDSNLDGFMTINELGDILGDELNQEEIEELFNDCKIRKNGKFCYEEFIGMIIETIKKSKRNTMKKMDVITKIENEQMLSHRSFNDDFNNNSIDRNNDSLEHIGYLKTNRNKKTDNFNKNLKQIKTNRNIEASHKKKVKEFELTSKSNSFNEYNLQYPKNLKKWSYKSTKGGFYFNENVNGIVANSFCLDLHHNSTLFFTIESFKTELHSIHNLDNMDVCLFIIRDDNKLSIECFTETKLDNKSCCKVDLTSGRYFLFPFTSGCHLKKHFNSDKLNKVQLLKQDLNGKTVLSSKFRDALNLVFDLIDLDSNGKLSQEEFNLYSFIRSNEDIPNKEWEFLGELVGFDRNELTKKSFLKLHLMEAQEENKDETDIIKGLTNLGFNNTLTIDQSFPFIVNIYSETSDFQILLSEIYEIKASETFLKQIIQSKSLTYLIKDIPEVNLHVYKNDFWSAIMVENISSELIKLEINCSKSENCLSNINNLIRKIHVKPNRTKTVMFLTNLDPNKDMVIRCKPSIIID